MPPGPLRRALEDFIETTPVPPRTLSWKERVDARGAECSALVVAMWGKSKITSIILSIALGILTLLYSWTGAQPLKDLIVQLCNTNIPEVLEDVVVDAMKTVFEDPAIAGMAQVYGAAIVDPVMNILENHASAQDGDPIEFLRAISGLGIELNVAGGLVDTLTQAATGGVVTGFGEFFSRMYQATGFSHAGWHTSQSFLGATLLPRLERYYSEKYRPRRFSASELRDLYALGELNPTEMRIAARSLGWREQDIDQWIKLAFKTVSESDIWDALHKGYKDWNWATERLRALGYDPADIPLLAQLNPMPPVNELTDVSKSTARAAYREGLISADQLRQYLDVLKVKPEEIELIIHLEDMTREAADKRLSVGQVKSAWTSNVITDAEARHWLDLAGFPGDQIEILLATWRAEIAPTFLKLNSGTVIGAYVEHIYNRPQAHDKLVSIGFAPEDATLELSLAELRNPDAFQPPAPPPAKLLTPGVLSELVYYGLMNPAQMQARLVELGYTDADATLIVARVAQLMAPVVKVLTEATVMRAYLAGVLTREAALARLIAMAYTPEDAERVVATVEFENPPVFVPELVQAVRLPSITALVAAVQDGLITEAEYLARCQEIGYSPEDSMLYLALATKNERKSTVQLSPSQIVAAYGKGLYSFGQSLGLLAQRGYSDGDATMLLRIQKDSVVNTEAWYGLLTGALGFSDVLTQLINAHYNDQDIVAAFGSLPPATLSALGVKIDELKQFLAGYPGGA